MRCVYLFAVLLVALFASEASAAETCPEEKCVPADHCDSPWQGATCAGSENTCCSLLKTEYRTSCSHHGGECMKWCNEDLRRDVSNKCPEGTTCCVLV